MENTTTKAIDNNDYITINRKVLKGLLKKIMVFLMATVTLVLIIFTTYKTVKYPETISSYFSHDLLIELESGNEEKIEEYRVRYIENDRYLFNGDLTFRLMCEKYNLDVETTKYMYEKSDYESIQNFFDNVIKDNY